LHKEMANLVPPSLRVRVVSPQNRQESVFTGGAMLSDIDGFKKMCVSKKEYMEEGPSIVHKKCI